jgi:hypothetical protein
MNEREESVIEQFQELANKMAADLEVIRAGTLQRARQIVELQSILNCLLFAIGKQRALNGAQLREHFLDYAAQFWKPGEAPPLVVNILTALEAGRQQRDAGME